MDMLSPLQVRDKMPLKDVTNSTPTPAAALAAAAAASPSPRKTTNNKRNKRTNSISIATTPLPPPPQRRSTRLSSLKTEPRDAEDGGETEPPSGRVMRSRRNAASSDAANVGGSVTTTRKRSGRKEPAGEGSVATLTRRRRTSTSAVASSPLDQKSRPQQIMPSTPSRPRLSPASSTAARTEASGMKSNKRGFQAFNETELENQPGINTPQSC